MKRLTALAALLFLVVCVYAQGRITVAQDGSGDYKTVQAALNAVPLGNSKLFTIFIKNGTYREKLHLDSTKNNVRIMGESNTGTILTYDDHPGKTTPGGMSINTNNSYSFLILGNDFMADNITFRNDAGFTAGQAVAVECHGDKAIFSNCRIIGNQDILFLNSGNSRQYYYKCYIEGTTDFIFGAAAAWFEQCHIHSKKNSHITAASTPQNHEYGFVFNNCTLTADSSLHMVSLGRPWRPYSKVVYMHTFMGPQIKPEGWSDWNDTHRSATARYAEFDSTVPGAATAKRVTWAKQLTPAEAKLITVKAVLSGWDPSVNIEISDKLRGMKID
jgi:pectinesterase